MADYDSDVEFDDDIPDPAAAKMWGTDDAFDWSEVELTDDEEMTLFGHYKAMGADRKFLIPIAIKALIPEKLRHCVLTDEIWQELPRGPAHAGWRPFMGKFTVVQCATVAQRFLTSVVYSPSGNAAINAYSGYGHYDVETPGVWVPDDEHEFAFVVDVSPVSAATAQMAAACLKVASDETYLTVKGKQMAVQIPCLKRVALGRHPSTMKPTLSKLLALPPPRKDKDGRPIKWTRGDLNKAPFIWEALANNMAKIDLPSHDMKPIPAYFLMMDRSVAVPNCRLDISKFAEFSKEMNFKTYRSCVKHAWYTGGVRVPQGYFMCLDQLMMRFTWSGHFTTRLPDWAMYYGAKFERAGASVGEPRLCLQVRSVADVKEYTGIVWNPQTPGSAYERACGVALPLGDNMQSTLKPGLEWLAMQTAECSAYAICAPQPYIVIRQGKGHSPCDENVVVKLYECAVAFCVYNYINSIACLVHKRPDKNIFRFYITVVDGKWVPFYDHVDCSTIVPGRYSSVSLKTSKEVALDSFFDRYRAGSGATKRGVDAMTDVDDPGRKRRK